MQNEKFPINTITYTYNGYNVMETRLIDFKSNIVPMNMIGDINNYRILKPDYYITIFITYNTLTKTYNAMATIVKDLKNDVIPEFIFVSKYKNDNPGIIYKNDNIQNSDLEKTFKYIEIKDRLTIAGYKTRPFTNDIQELLNAKSEYMTRIIKNCTSKNIDLIKLFKEAYLDESIEELFFVKSGYMHLITYNNKADCMPLQFYLQSNGFELIDVSPYDESVDLSKIQSNFILFRDTYDNNIYILFVS